LPNLGHAAQRAPEPVPPRLALTSQLAPARRWKRSTRPQRLRLAFSACVFILLILATLFAATEAGFRIVEAAQLRSIISENSESTWSVYDEDLFYRPRNLPAPAPKGTTFRALFLGDSLIGGPKGDNIVGRVDAVMNHNPSFVKTEWINTGVPGYTNYQELVYLKKYGLAWQPDLVGVVFCLNDVHKFLHNLKVENGKLLPGGFWNASDSADTSKSWLLRMARRSLFLRWLHGKTTLAGRTVQMYERHGYDFDYRPDFNTAWQDAEWSMIRDQMAEMVELGKAHSFRVFLVVVPFGEQYRAEYLARDRNYVLKPQRILKDQMAEMGIPYLDLYPALNFDSFVPDHIHLTSAGKQRAAEQIAKFLSDKTLIPGVQQ
jgi:lysophospholipase L1-like esterase